MEHRSGSRPWRVRRTSWGSAERFARELTCRSCSAAAYALHDRRGRGRRGRDARLIEAGFDLLGTSGAAATTVRAVCQHSGLTRRFYESFTNIDELLVAVFDDIMAQMVERVTAAVGAAQGSLAETVEGSEPRSSR
jgi:hypothetical protein